MTYRESNGESDVMYWTRQRIPGRSIQYRRPRNAVQADRRLTVVQRRQGENFWVSVGANGPPPGTMVGICVEIVDDDIPSHEIPFSTLPTQGPFRNWSRHHKIGIRLEWEQAGQQKYMWVQSGHHYDPVATQTGLTVPGAHGPYLKMDSIRRFLEQKTFSNTPNWFYNHGKVARILDVNFDYLSQTWHLTEIAPPPAEVYNDTQYKFTDVEIVQNLVDAGFAEDRIAVTADVLSGTGKRGRKTCDRCAGANRPRAFRGTWPWDFSHPPCTIPEGHNACEPCLTFGIPCTFTSSDVLFASPNLLNAIARLPNPPRAGKVYDDVDLRTVQG
jgi:hypothetical protein